MSEYYNSTILCISLIIIITNCDQNVYRGFKSFNNLKNNAQRVVKQSLFYSAV